MEEIRIHRVDPAASGSRPQTVAHRSAQESIKAGTGKESSTEVDLGAAVQGLNDMAARNQINLNFSVDESTGQTVIKVIDSETKQIVRQVPPKEILDLAASFEKMAGTLLQAQA